MALSAPDGYQKSDGKRRANPTGGKIFPDVAPGRFWQTNPPATRRFRGRVTPHPAITRRAVVKVPHPIVPMRRPCGLPLSARPPATTGSSGGWAKPCAGRAGARGGETALTQLAAGAVGPVGGWPHPGSGCHADWCRIDGRSDTVINTRRHCLLRQEPPLRQGQASKGACLP
jgi:hypothetical protein